MIGQGVATARFRETLEQGCIIGIQIKDFERDVFFFETGQQAGHQLQVLWLVAGVDGYGQPGRGLLGGQQSAVDKLWQQWCRQVVDAVKVVACQHGQGRAFPRAGTAANDDQAHAQAISTVGAAASAVWYRAWLSGALRRRSRKVSLSNRAAICRSRARCCSVAVSGTSNTNSKSTGAPSMALKSTGLSRCKIAPIGVVQPARRQWGMAIPLPKPVEPSFSRAIRLSNSRSELMSGWSAANSAAMNSSTLFLLPPGTFMRERAGDRMFSRRIID